MTLVDKKYGRNITGWNADEQWVCETASLSMDSGGSSVFAQYFDMLYPSREAGEAFNIGEEQRRTNC